jgi:hypothetical protein
MRIRTSRPLFAFRHGHVAESVPNAEEAVVREGGRERAKAALLGDDLVDLAAIGVEVVLVRDDDRAVGLTRGLAIPSVNARECAGSVRALNTAWLPSAQGSFSP